MGTNIQVCFTCLSTDLKFIRFENIDRNIAAFYERFVADGSDNGTTMQNLDYLCENCCMQLKNSYIFWKQCMQSKNRLGNYLLELENQRNYYRMQENRNNEIVVKNEDGENIVLMELGSTNNTTSTSSQHQFNHHNENNHYQDFNHHFGEQQSFGEHGQFGEHPVIKSEDDYQDQSYFMNNMDFDFNGEEASNNKRKSSKDLVKPYGCNLCTHKFVNKGNLKRHLAIIHSDPAAVKETQLNGSNLETYQCPHCPKKLQSKNNLNRHLLKHSNANAIQNTNNSNPNPNQNQNQNQNANMNQSNNLNQEIINLVETFQCNKCGKRFDNRIQLMTHEETHLMMNGEMMFECEICKTEFTDFDDLRNHRALHEPQYKCNFCYMIFESNEGLNKHSVECSMNKGEMDLVCMNCEVKFDSIENLDIHQSQCNINNEKQNFKEHKSDPKSFTCSICSKKFNSKPKYEDHLNLHSGMKPYECMLCEKAFSSGHYLDMHLKVHTSEENLFKCIECDKCFSSKTVLLKHENIHKEKIIKEKVYKCQECNITFNNRSTLYQHMKTHKETKIMNNTENNSTTTTEQPSILQPNDI